MRVALVQLPPMPVGALTLAAVGESCGVRVELHDFPRRGGEEALVDALAGAAVVGFTTVCTKYPRAVLLARALKIRSPGTLVVFGGPQATTTHEETLTAFPQVDLVMRGEAEAGFAALLEEVGRGGRDWSRLPGAAWREPGGVIRANELAPLAEDLDVLPIPAYERYPGIAAQGFAMVEVGRGCPYTCTFCCTNRYFSRRPRMKSAGRIVAELLRLNELYGIRTFDFVHDMFTYNPAVVRDLCAALGRLPFTWGCSARTDSLTPELLEIMGAAGCRGFYFGVETGSPRLQRLLQKNLDVHEAVDTIRRVKRLGFRATVSVILGFPQETRADVRDSLLLTTTLLAEGVDTLQLPVWGPLAHTPLTEDWGDFVLDETPSNFADNDGVPGAEERALIRSSFGLFSTFYHPAGTALARSDYVAMATALEALPRHPALRRWLLDVERVPFVDFLAAGGYGAPLLGQGEDAILEGVLRAYLARPGARDAAVVRMLAFDRLHAEVARGGLGAGGRVDLGPVEASVALASAFPRMPVGPLGPGRELALHLRARSDGVAMAAAPISEP